MTEPSDEDRLVAYSGIVLALRLLEKTARRNPPPDSKCSAEGMVAIFAEARRRFEQLVEKYDKRMDSEFRKQRKNWA